VAIRQGVLAAAGSEPSGPDGWHGTGPGPRPDRRSQFKSCPRRGRGPRMPGPRLSAAAGRGPHREEL